jgi:hypothetical protein
MHRAYTGKGVDQGRGTPCINVRRGARLTGQSAFVAGASEVVCLAEQLLCCLGCRWSWIDYGQPPQGSIDRMGNHSVGDAWISITGRLAWLVAGPLNEGGPSSGNIYAEGSWPVKARPLIFGVVLRHDGRKRLSCFGHDAVGGVVEECVAPGKFWRAISLASCDGQCTVEAFHQSNNFIDGHDSSISFKWLWRL